MEHPIFSLSTKPDLRVRRYEHRDAWIEIKPSSDGLATIHDRDILIYCISQLMAGLNAGRVLSPIVRFKAIELLTATNRVSSGRGYDLLKSALERLAGTRITTNIVTGDQEITRGFGLIESFEIVRETWEGRMQEVEIKLSDWVFNAIKSREVLTLHRDYFRLRRPIERRMYELARKHCGRKQTWKISLDLLRKKSGSGSTLKEFKRLVKQVVEVDSRNHHMPDYSVRLEISQVDGSDQVVFFNRGSMPAIADPARSTSDLIVLSVDAHHEARLVAPGWDVYELEKQWRTWMDMSDLPPPSKPDAAFVGFCRKWSTKRGSPRL